jgi:hypothetical protein
MSYIPPQLVRLTILVELALAEDLVDITVEGDTECITGRERLLQMRSMV